MAPPPLVPGALRNIRERLLRRTTYSVLLILVVLLILCLVFAWTTRDAMMHLPARAQGLTSAGARKSIVDLSPWQTAQALAALAVTAEENQYARDAERLADHEVDQAFAAALRQATIQAQNRKLTGDALALSKRIDQLQQLVSQDQEQVRQLTANSSSATKAPSESSTDDTDLDIAKAQLQLDSDELDDAQQDLARASGDQRAQIQSELAAHEAAMKKYDSESGGDGQIAILSVAHNGTLAGRLGAWNRQRSRQALLAQAITQTQNDIRSLTEQHNALEAQANASDAAASGSSQDHATRLAAIKNRTAQRQLLSIYDDRIQTAQQLAGVYANWSAQLLRQHRIVMHLILQSSAWILVILICMLLGDRLVRRLTSHPSLGRREMQTLRMILQLAIQVAGVILILLVIFGAPQQTSTMLGLATAALTIALQDYVLAFFGWFRLAGKRGIRVGDWVEINGVAGEVAEIGLMTTTLLETGNLADRGYPTGRSISFMNGFAIRGQFFNFSTTGQWTWDEITVAVPASVDAPAAVDRILHAVQHETRENSRIAEQEWKRGTHGVELGRFRTDPAVNLRPSASGIDLEVRYVTRASERFEMRNRLYQQVFNMLHEPPTQTGSEPLSPSEPAQQRT